MMTPVSSPLRKRKEPIFLILLAPLGLLFVDPLWVTICPSITRRVMMKWM